LFCLNAVVSPGTPLNCPCLTTTSSSSTTTLGATTTSSTTLGATTTTTLEPCPPQTATGAESHGPISCGCLVGGFPQCDGTCPENHACRPEFEGQNCYCEELGCGEYEGYPECFGLCDEPNDVCVLNGDGGCDCVDKDDPICNQDLQAPVCEGDGCFGASLCAAQCGDAAAPQCDGGCPSGQFCHDLVEGGCGCVNVTCGSFAGPSICAGVCPPGLACIDFGGTCGCTATIPDP
jgi:hypothetical protein